MNSPADTLAQVAADLPQIRRPAWWDAEQKWRTPRLSAANAPRRRAAVLQT